MWSWQLVDLLHLKSRCWFCFSCAAGEFLRRSKGHSVYFVAVAGLQVLPYLLLTSSITIFYWQLSRSALFSPLFYCFFIFLGVPVRLACSSVGNKQNLFCKVGGGKKLTNKVGQKERKGAPKGCKIVQSKSCAACCFQSAVYQLEAPRECERKRRDNAEKW